MIDIIKDLAEYYDKLIELPLLLLGIIPGLFILYRIIAWYKFVASGMRANLVAIINIVVFLAVGLPLFFAITNALFLTDNPLTWADSMIRPRLHGLLQDVGILRYKIELWIIVAIWILIGFQFIFNITLKMRGLYVLDRKVHGPSSIFEQKQAKDADIMNVRTAHALGANIRIYRHFGKTCIKYADLAVLSNLEGIINK